LVVENAVNDAAVGDPLRIRLDWIRVKYQLILPSLGQMRSSSFLQDHQQYKPMAPINPISQTIGEVALLVNGSGKQLFAS
jgi:hypothetical protein